MYRQKSKTQVKRERIEMLRTLIAEEKKRQSYTKYVKDDAARLLESASRKVNEARRALDEAIENEKSIKEKIEVAPIALEDSIRREKEYRDELKAIHTAPKIEDVTQKLARLRAKIAALESEVA